MNKVIKERYVLKEYIAKGGMGEVWLCFDNILKINRAVKIIRNITKYNVVKGESLEEVEILKRLNHPGIPKIKDYIVEQPYHYIIMEYVKGDTLYHKVEKEGKQAEHQVLNWGIEICDILLYLHSISPYPIIYRDLKPDNILLDENGKIKLVDFGVSCYQTVNEYFMGPYLGTPGYASPEQVRAGTLDIRSDIYNFGKTLVFLLTGSTYSGYFPNYELHSISKPLYVCLKCCLMHRPYKRFQTVSELKKELCSIVCFHKKKRTRVRVVVSVMIFFLVLFAFSYAGVEAYHAWCRKELFAVAMQNGDYALAIQYQCTNVEPYVLYYLQCIQESLDLGYKEGIQYAIKQIEMFDISNIEYPEMLFYQIAQDCLFMNTMDYYEKAFEYLNRIARVKGEMKKEVQLYLNVSSLLRKYTVLNTDELLQLSDQLQKIYAFAQQEVDVNKQLEHYFILLEIFISRSNELGVTSYEQMLKIIHDIRRLWNEDMNEMMINNKLSKTNLTFYEILAYYYLGMFEQNRKNDERALYNYNNMLMLFDEYQKKYEVNESLFMKVSSAYLYKFEIEQEYHDLQDAKRYYKKALELNADHDIVKKGLEYIMMLEEMMG